MRELNTGSPGKFFHDATNRRLADGRGVFSAGGKWEMDATIAECASRFSVISKVLMLQLGLSAFLAMLFWGIDGGVAAYSTLLGGLTCVIPNAFLALRLVVSRHNPEPSALVRAVYIGELGKLVLTILIFSIIFTLVRPFAAWPLFAGFIGVQMATFAGLLMQDKEI